MSRKASKDRKPWDQLAGENVTSYLKFCRYRDMKYTTPQAQRSLRALASEMGIGRQQVEDLSARFNWVERVEAYDLDIARQIRERNEDDIMKMRKNHALIASQMLTKATKRLLTIPEEDMTAADIVRLVDVGVKVERLSRGEPTELQEHSGEVKAVVQTNPDMSALTIEELRRLAAIDTGAEGADTVTGGEGDGKA